MGEPIRVLPDRALVGVVHLEPLPGSPGWSLPLAGIIARACTDAHALADAGFDALIIENFGDAPFRATQVGPETVAAMTVVVRAVQGAVNLPLGVNVLRNDARAGIAIATVCGAGFVRVNVHTGVYAADQGLIEGQAHDTLLYRRRLSEGVPRADGGGPRAPAIFADVQVKHARCLSSHSIAEAARETAYRGLADAVIVTGTATGQAADLADVRAVREAVPDRPLFVGSGVTADTVAELLRLADGVIVGTALKQGGVTTAPVDPARAAAFVRAARR